ncbi:MAG: DUF3606 domain-containing protein [Myxococcaceae bacterium]
MTEKNKDWAADAARVAMSQKHEVAYWTRKWGISEEQLAAAHKVAGPMAEKIEAHLKKTGVIK